MTADLAVITMAALCLANMVMEHRWRMKTADRTRLVSPPKAQTATAATVEDLSKRRPA